MGKLAEKVRSKERFVGLRFLYPVYYIPEVEFTPHKDTGNWVVEKLRTLLSQTGKTLFFRSGSEPLILTEEKREMRKQQRIDELRLSSGLPPLMNIRQDSNVPELGRNLQSDLHKLFLRRNPNQGGGVGGGGGGGGFFGFDNDFDHKKNNKSKKAGLEPELDNGGGLDNDCAICMDSIRNSVLRPCNHMITCFTCSTLLLNRQDNCPICRDKIEDVIKIFMS
jgi:hypothetical protein